jgi:hypothetical protein
VLALAALTKYTGLVVTTVVLAFVGLKLLAVEGRGVPRVAASLAIMVAWIALLGGGPYLRNWWYFGDPFVWNLDLPGALSWWQPPSFRTTSYYLGFGESLRHPYFSLFRSFWDAMYSGLWGEGLPPSANTLEGRHAYWNYEMMSATYALAVPATLLMILGFLRAVRGAFRDERAGRCIALALMTTLIYVLAFSLVQVSTRYPFWGGARVTYMLGLVVPGVLCGALGLSAFDRWLERRGFVVLRAVYYGWLCALVGCIVLAFAS